MSAAEGEQANGWASGPVLQSLFLVVLAHSGLGLQEKKEKKGLKRKDWKERKEKEISVRRMEKSREDKRVESKKEMEEKDKKKAEEIT